MSSSRSLNSIKNSAVGVVAQILIIILNFIIRTLFIKTLGNQYLGLNGLFSNIVSLLSLSELGIGTAVIFNLYKAVAENDSYRINALLTLYAKAYKMIAGFIFVIGITLSFNLQHIIKDNPFEPRFLQFIFILIILNTVASYLFAYRSSIIYVNQKDYICKLVNLGCTVVSVVAQILILVLLKNYIVYLIMQTVFIILQNIILFVVAKKMYPDVVCNKKYKLEKPLLDDIILRVRALLIHSISGVVVFGTDNIFISKFIGILEVGLYSNYSLIINTAGTVINQVVGGITASVGNFVASETIDKVYLMFQKLNFICFWVYCVAFTAIIVLTNQFILIWLGSENILDFRILVVLAINFLILGLRQPIMIIRNVSGHFVYDRIVAIIKPTLNILFSILLVNMFGLIGIFIGTLISSLIADILLFPYFLYKHLFKRSVKEYYVKYLYFSAVIIFSTVLVYLGSNRIFNTENIYLSFLVKTIICLVIPNMIIVCMFRKTGEYAYTKQVLRASFFKITHQTDKRGDSRK